MKINWGTGIVIAFAIFMSFILYFVLQMTLSSEYDGEMVLENYYEREYVYQQEIDAQQNANTLKQNIIVAKNQDAFYVSFPQEMDYKNISGMIHMYRPSDKNLDFNIPIQLDSSSYAIPSQKLAEGRWEVKIRWKYEEVNYLFKKVVYN